MGTLEQLDALFDYLPGWGAESVSVLRFASPAIWSQVLRGTYNECYLFGKWKSVVCYDAEWRMHFSEHIKYVLLSKLGMRKSQ